MCEPVTLIALTTLALSAASAGVGYVGEKQNAEAQNEMAQRNADAAGRAYHEQAQQEALRLQQVQASAQQDREQSGIEGIKSRGTLRAGAGEAGVSGVSLDMLVNNFYQQEEQFNNASLYNFGVEAQNSQASMRQARATAKNRALNQPTAGTPGLAKPLLATAGSALSSYGTYLSQRGPEEASRAAPVKARYNPRNDLQALGRY